MHRLIAVIAALGAALLTLAATASAQLQVSEGTTRISQALYFENYAGGFLSIQASDQSATSSDQLVASWGEGPDAGTEALTRHTDAGVYIMHRGLFEVTARPDYVTVRRDDDNWSRLKVEDWAEPPAPRPGSFQSGFNDRYLDAREISARIGDLAAEFPASSQAMLLPEQTDGYQRKSQIILGTDPAGTVTTPAGGVSGQAVVITSNAYGHEGGNSIRVSLSDPGSINSALSVGVTGSDIEVSLATGAAGQITSTAAQVVSAINASPAAGALVSANTYRGNAGAGIPVPTAAPVALTDSLSAPGGVPRGPQTMRALRIGTHRDGSRPGVLIVGGVAARSWAGPMTAIEFAEQLLRNYATDPEIKSLVDDLDIFVLPVANPDGNLYSHYDFSGQRKTMRSTCPATGASDPAARDSWGVDLNRNFSVGSIFDGYTGASTNCLSDTFAGSSEMSEPETRNIAWLANTFPNIDFAAELSSFGGYIMRPPGAYQPSGRIQLEAPPVEQIGFFDEIASRIVSRIARTRQNVVLPLRVGATNDVLYSAPGNVVDYLYYQHGIFAQTVNVGIDRYSGTSWLSVGFQPDFATETSAEAIESADGLTGLLEVAQEWGDDEEAPEVTLNPAPGKYAMPLEFGFVADEPARIHYTLDGSEPDENSPVWEPEAPYAGLEPIEVTETTTVRWFATDVKGNRSEEESATYVNSADPDDEPPTPPNEPKPPAPPVGPESPVIPDAGPLHLLLSATGNTRCIGNPRLARTKRDLRARLVLAEDAKVILRLQQRLPARAKQPRACPSRISKPKKRPRFRGRVPVRVGKQGKVKLKRISRQVTLKKGTRKIAVLRALGARKLASGHYRVWIVVRDGDGNASGEAALHFRVLRR